MLILYNNNKKKKKTVDGNNLNNINKYIGYIIHITVDH